MRLVERINQLKVQLLEVEKLLAQYSDNPIMRISLEEKLELIKSELSSMPTNIVDSSITLLFGGKAVWGSKGIKSSFVSKILKPFQEIIVTQAALQKYGFVGSRGKTKQTKISDLYLTSLPTGSFGFELSLVEYDELFEQQDFSDAIQKVISLIQCSADSDELFEQMIDVVPARSLSNLSSFLKEVSNEDSFLKLSSGIRQVEISVPDVKTAADRVSSLTTDNSVIVVNGVLRGILLNSGRFEIISESGENISGFLSPSLSEDHVILAYKNMLNEQVNCQLSMHETTFKTGRHKITYELLDLQAAK